jgi:N6-adenosine-specific RNA methylase IME4
VSWTLQGQDVTGRYEILYADPPWAYRDRGGPKGQGGAAAQYPVMKPGDLAQIPIGDLAAPNTVLFLWATYPTLPDALLLMEHWGFEYRSIAFQWLKIYPSGQPRFGLGHWTRGNTEPCLLGVRGKPHRIDAGVSQLIFSEELIVSEIGKHSAKPPETRERIIRLMGDLPACELFAREIVPGWDAFGNEIDPGASLRYDQANPQCP